MVSPKITWTMIHADNRIATFEVGDEQFKIIMQRFPYSRREGHSARKTHGYIWTVSIYDSAKTRRFTKDHTFSTSPVRDAKNDVEKFVKTLGTSTSSENPTMARKNPADSKGFYFETGENSSYGTPQRVYIAIYEPEDIEDEPLFIFQFGAYGDTKVAVLGVRNLERAMAPAGQWLEDHAPGIFTEIEYPDDLSSLDDVEMHEAVEELERDMTNFSADGSSQWWVPSWEWSVNEYEPASKVHRRAIAAVYNAKPARSKNPTDGGAAKRMMNPRNY